MIEKGRFMGRQAGDEPGPGSAPDPGEPLPALLAAFEKDGSWDVAAPSAALAMALETAAGPEGLYDGAETASLVGIARQWAAIESWAGAGVLGAVRAMMREDHEGVPLLRRRLDLPDGWGDNLVYQLAGALAMGPVSAGNLAGLAWALCQRLPGIGRLLVGGALTKAKAKLVVTIFEPLTEDEAARAEALILGDLPGKTWPQVERLAWRAALAVAPDIAERRRKAAERHRARVTLFREESGAAGLSGRDLPAAQALAGHANVVARGRIYEDSGAFPGHTSGALQALAYVHLLRGVSAEDAIAFARTGDGGGPDDDHGSDDGGGDLGGGGNPGADGNPADESDPDGGDPGDGAGPDDSGDGGTEGRLVLPQVTAPLATLQRRAERPGETRLLGPIDPALTRDLAHAAACSPHARWEITIVDERGYAIGHGTARPRRRRQQPQPPPHPASCAFPARVNITVAETLLRQLAEQAVQPRPGAPPGDWELAPRTNAEDGPWALTLPGGRELAVRFDAIPTHDCDHRHQVNAYRPSDRLRRLVQIRDYECTFPPCSRPAHESDFEHAIPYDKGGKTDACNAGARSRRCHQVKQMQGWSVRQPKPGWHVWTTPTGRTYTPEPWRYIAER